jgi:AAA+ superfamily predicted ATPase
MVDQAVVTVKEMDLLLLHREHQDKVSEVVNPLLMYREVKHQKVAVVAVVLVLSVEHLQMVRELLAVLE